MRLVQYIEEASGKRIEMTERFIWSQLDILHKFEAEMGEKLFAVKAKQSSFEGFDGFRDISSRFDDYSDAFFEELKKEYPTIANRYEPVHYKYKAFQKELKKGYAAQLKTILFAMRNLVFLKEFEEKMLSEFKKLQIALDTEFYRMPEIMETIISGGNLCPEDCFLLDRFNNFPDFRRKGSVDYRFKAGERKRFYLRKISKMINAVDVFLSKKDK